MTRIVQRRALQHSSPISGRAPYSLRGRTHPTVAAPRTWAELNEPHLHHLDYQEVLEHRRDQQRHQADQLGSQVGTATTDPDAIQRRRHAEAALHTTLVAAAATVYSTAAAATTTWTAGVDDAWQPAHQRQLAALTAAVERANTAGAAPGIFAELSDRFHQHAQQLQAPQATPIHGKFVEALLCSDLDELDAVVRPLYQAIDKAALHLSHPRRQIRLTDHDPSMWM